MSKATKNKSSKTKRTSLIRAYLTAGGYLAMFLASITMFYVAGDLYRYTKEKLLRG